MNKKLLITTLTILGLAIIAGGFWYVKNQQKENVVIKEKQEQQEQHQKKDNNKENENQKQEEQKNEEDEGENNKESDFKKIDTSNWKEYCNQEYGFCVKYPEGWKVSAYICRINNNYCGTMNNDFFAKFTAKDDCSVGVLVWNGLLWDKSKTIAKKEFNGRFGTLKKIIFEKIINANKNEFYCIEHENLNSDRHMKEYECSVIKHDKLIVFSLVEVNKGNIKINNCEKYKPILESMLNNFN